MKARYDSIRGPIVSGWKLEGRRLSCSRDSGQHDGDCLCAGERSEYRHRERQAASEAVGVKLLRTEAGAAVLEVESGRYRFEAK